MTLYVSRHHKGGISVRVEISAKNIRGEFVKKVEELSGQDVFSCYQCGKCSAGCPIVSKMDVLPNQVIRLLQLGQEEEVLAMNTIWLCASCFSCESKCPKGIDLARLMEALRLIILRSNEDHVEASSLSDEEMGDLPQIALICNFRKFTS